MPRPVALAIGSPRTPAGVPGVVAGRLRPGAMIVASTPFDRFPVRALAAGRTQR